MDVVRCYRILLGLYPGDFRQQFSGEMLHVFEQRASERFAFGKTASIVFVFREFGSLLRGAQTMWMDKVFSTAKQVSKDNLVSDRKKKHVLLPLFFRQEKTPIAAGHQTGDANSETGLSSADIQRLRDAAVNNMVRAIAGHDFPGARHYSAEESRLQRLLREVNEPMKSQRTESA
jgi:hypothetical protein